MSPRTLLTLPNPTLSEIIVIPSGLLSQLLRTLNGYGIDGQVERKLMLLKMGGLAPLLFSSFAMYWQYWALGHHCLETDVQRSLTLSGLGLEGSSGRKESSRPPMEQLFQTCTDAGGQFVARGSHTHITHITDLSCAQPWNEDSTGNPGECQPCP